MRLIYSAFPVLAVLLVTANSLEAQRPVPPPGTEYVASVRGRVYYRVSCDGWHSLATANLRWFRSASEARAAGLAPSTQPGCGEPLSGNSEGGTAPGTETCTVASSIDGDTLRCVDGRVLRLLLVDAPELGSSEYGVQAKAYLDQIAAAGVALRVEYDIDRHDRNGRDLVYAFTGPRMINEELLRSGMAVVSVHPPNVRYLDRLRAVSDSAKESRRGLWATTAFECSPADQRARRCQ